MHHIQHYILNQLSTTKWARFSEMRPPKVDSNAYSYHLKLLQRQRLIEKHDEKGYRLSPLGLAKVDRMSKDELQVRIQPKIITMCVLYNENNEMLLLTKSKQPFIGAWTFVSGKLHIDDRSERKAATREIKERVNVASNDTLIHAADVYIYASISGQMVSTVLAHIFTMHISTRDVVRQDIVWANGIGWQDLQLAPGIKEVHELLEANKNIFTYAEFTIDW